MNSATHRFGLRLFFSAFALAGVLLVPVMIQVRAANDFAGKKPSVDLHTSKASITLPCQVGRHSINNSCPKELEPVVLIATAVGFNKQAVYSYSVPAGQIIGAGSNVSWDLIGVGPGVYTATVEVHDSHKHLAAAAVTVTIAMCGDCVITCDLPCPTISVTCYDKVKAGTPITCKVNAQGGSDRCNASVGWSPQKSGYKWSARSSNGEDLSGTITSNGQYVSIPTEGRAGQTVYATVEILGLDGTCNSTASSTTRVGN